MAPNIFNKIPSLWRTPRMIIARAFQTMRHSKPPGNNNECESQAVFKPTSDIELENEESESGRNGLNSLLPGLHSSPTSSLLQSAISPWTTQPAMLPYEYDPRAAIQDSSFTNIGGDMHSSTVNDHSHHERVEHNYHTNITYHLHFRGVVKTQNSSDNMLTYLIIPSCSESRGIRTMKTLAGDSLIESWPCGASSRPHPPISFSIAHTHTN
ncbi:hypothetical protein F5890DRAFT_1110903 [Lentinula detonsa]|uniref:Uncharacterized protein n=1 Tax=Lentinula detonsa TaxID=2804962 RepID=A0AA38UU35_9AGAR|nr:hypothetical protein F5890DRAFT_1110903 [Lentinula detonsa]